MNRRKKAPEKDNSERWLLTYSDLMNLLLILFIILYCSSQINAQKAAQVAKSMHEGFGGYIETNVNGNDVSADAAASGSGEDTTVSGSDGDETGDGSGTDTYWSQETAEYQGFYDNIAKIIDEDGLQDKVDVKLDDRGIVISFKDTVLFTSGSAELSADAVNLIDQIGSMLSDLPFAFLLIEGHTDTDPIHNSQYKDNMDLSTQRAGNVWRQLVSFGLPEDKMAAIGYGETRPIAPNDTPENKAKNRRVVVTILRTDIDVNEEIASGVKPSEASGNAASASVNGDASDSNLGAVNGSSP